MTERMEAEYYLRFTFPKFFEKKTFSSEIIQISPSFDKIYNESKQAEEIELDQIAGVGYRKALEFLIKDYLILLFPNEKESIIKKRLGNCIREDIKDDNIKKCANRAAWLGNDEAHYFRKWETKDIDHLKNCINLVVGWITLGIQTEKLVDDMP